MVDRILTLRELNRATLARQMLLERESLSVPAAIERLGGLQAQLPVAPYVALWTRLRDFERNDLARLLEDHTVIKATLMRATLHLVTADDYPMLRAAVLPALTGAFEAISVKRGEGLDFEKIVAAGKRYISETPRTFAEISAMLTEMLPDADVGAMRYAVRTLLPLVQVPISSGWSYPGNPQFTLAESWIGKLISDKGDFRALVFRYLGAFGPASVTDIQTWSGLGKLKDAVEKLKPDLVTYRDEQKREVFDLPDTMLPDTETPVPPRFLPEFDSLLLAHNKRTRVIADQYRSKVYLPGLRVAATILVDGVVAGVWKVEKAKGAATLMIEPFEPLTKSVRDVLGEDGERLVRFVEGSAKSYDVRFAE